MQRIKKVYCVMPCDLKVHTKELYKKMNDTRKILGFIDIPKIRLTKVVLYSDYLKFKRGVEKNIEV